MEERYYETMKQIHSILRPNNYLEIGVRRGDSWALVADHVRSIGIDPAPQLTMKPPGKASLFEATSDKFFEQNDPKAILGGPIDLSFIDGMHLFEYALRDFTNIERHSKKDSFILVHDCLPIDKTTAERVPFTGIWTGDIWKLVLCLKEYRPDLSIEVLDTSPSGLAVITNLNPNNDNWRRIESEAIDRFIQMPYEYLGDRQMMRKLLNVCDASTETLRRIFSGQPQESRPASASAKHPPRENFDYEAIIQAVEQSLRTAGRAPHGGDTIS